MPAKPAAAAKKDESSSEEDSSEDEAPVKKAPAVKPAAAAIAAATWLPTAIILSCGVGDTGRPVVFQPFSYQGSLFIQCF